MVVVYILLAVLAFGVIILIHELGHYLTARACGVGVNEFAIGMGPKIISHVSKKSGIRYSIRALPIGGFVSMVGEDEESDADNAFGNVAIWKRMIIIVSGAFMNFVLGILIILIMVLSTKYLPVNIVAEFKPDATSSQYGLMVNDKVIKVGNRNIYTGYELSYEIMNQGYEPIDLVVIRNNEKIVLNDVVFGTFTESGAVFGDIDFTPYGVRKNIGNVILHTCVRAVSTVRMVWDSIFDMISGRYGIEAVSGPVGITETIVDIAEADANRAMNILHICSVITINLGIVNLLPFPALDGGRFVFMLVEAIRKKPIKKEVEGYIHFIGILLLFAFMIVISLKDIWSIFTR